MFIITLVIISCDVFSKNIWCSGKVSRIYIDRMNSVIIYSSWRNEWTRMCSTDGADGASVVTCSHWVSFLTNSINEDKSVTVMYSNLNDSAECDNLETYANAPAPSYIMYNK